MCTVVVVVDDSPDLLVTYLPEEAPFSFPRSADGRPHPWLGKERWQGHGVLTLQRPAESYAVWHFWDGPERRFAGWYLNLQRPFRRTSIGYDTQDLELDVWIPAAGPWSFKDEDKLEERRADGRFTEAEVAEIRSIGSEIAVMLDRGEQWWDESWAAVRARSVVAGAVVSGGLGRCRPRPTDRIGPGGRSRRPTPRPPQAASARGSAPAADSARRRVLGIANAATAPRPTTIAPMYTAAFMPSTNDSAVA